MDWAEINHFEPRSVIVARLLVIVVSALVLLLAARVPFDRLRSDPRRLGQDLGLALTALVVLVSTTILFFYYWFYVVLRKITEYATSHPASQLLRHWRHDVLWELEKSPGGNLRLNELGKRVLLDKYNVDLAVTPYGYVKERLRIVDRLRRDPEWVEVWSNPDSVVFARASALPEGDPRRPAPSRRLPPTTTRP